MQNSYPYVEVNNNDSMNPTFTVIEGSHRILSLQSLCKEFPQEAGKFVSLYFILFFEIFLLI
jgi:hypothetical protein